jgi:hypothetical protein
MNKLYSAISSRSISTVRPPKLSNKKVHSMLGLVVRWSKNSMDIRNAEKASPLYIYVRILLFSAPSVIDGFSPFVTGITESVISSSSDISISRRPSLSPAGWLDVCIFTMQDIPSSTIIRNLDVQKCLLPAII